MGKKTLLRLINWYQQNQGLRTLIGSHLLLLGGDCKYIPTCSEYSVQALKKYGVIKGVFLSTKRILSCNPFSKGGLDPLIK